MFEVQTRFTYGWDNVWTDETGAMLRFKTRAKAQSEIDDVLECVTEAGMDYTAADYRIVEV